MILSYAWTTPSVVLRMKNRTRRDWTEVQIERVLRQIEKGREFDAWSAGPHRGGKPFGLVRPTALVLDEDASAIPDEDWEREGFHVLLALGSEFAKGHNALDVWKYWRESEPGTNLQTVVDFEVTRLNDLGERLRDESAAALEAAGGPVPLALASSWSATR